jgi:hypothetical protein
MRTSVCSPAAIALCAAALISTRPGSLFCAEVAEAWVVTELPINTFALACATPANNVSTIANANNIAKVFFVFLISFPLFHFVV